MSNSSMRPIDIPYQVILLRIRVDMEAMSVNRYRVLHKTQALSSIRLYSDIPDDSLVESFSSAEMKSVFSAAPSADWAVDTNKYNCYKRS